MEKKEKEGQNTEKPVLKIIDYIDDRGDRRRTYTSNKEVETYIKNNYSIVRSEPTIEKLTP